MLATEGPAAILGVTITFLILDILVVGTRFFRIKLLGERYRIDDWLVLPALALNIGMSVAIFVGVSRHATGYPTPAVTSTRSIMRRTPLDQSNATISINNEVFFIVFSLFAASVSFSKASILCFYWRIFGRAGQWHNVRTIAIGFMLVIVTLFGIGTTFAYTFGCGSHFSYYWSTAGATILENCIDSQVLLLTQTVSDFAIDAIVILMPLPMVWGLQMKIKRKLAVSAIFLTASLAVIASLVKMVWFLWENETPWNPAYDQDLIVSTLVFWTILETHVGLLAVCLPTLRIKINNTWSLASAMSNLRSKISLESLRKVKSREKRQSMSPSDGPYDGSRDLNRVVS
ncbi:hypothetical protein F5Y17DRAFT_192496 [Xylariaceae sp. FL0594]|nr:hypothetical protein F5Y17DRAFT_192496 [Xylariaceae sp. FL0594]